MHRSEDHASLHNRFIHFAAPKEIFAEEMSKKPCIWYQRGTCQYGLSCHNSHYTPEQIEQLRQHVHHMHYIEWQKQQPKQYNHQLIDDFMAKRERTRWAENLEANRNIWNYPEEWQNQVASLPLSLQPINRDLIPETLAEWG